MKSRRSPRPSFVTTFATVAGVGIAVVSTAGCGGAIDGDPSEYTISSNPPPPEPPLSLCPPSVPTESSCSVEITCKYGNCAGGAATKMATCKGRTWQVLTMSCNPPFPLQDAGDAGDSGGRDSGSSDSGSSDASDIGD